MSAGARVSLPRDRINDLLFKGLEDGVFPGAVLLVGRGGEMIHFEAVGHLSLIPEPAPMKKDTIFDLASLTKPLATALAFMKVVDEGKVELDQHLGEIIRPALLKEKESLTPRLLLTHTGGFTDWKPFYLALVDQRPHERKRVLRQLLVDTPLAYPPGEKCLYSDLGFMVLEWVLEALTGSTLPFYLEKHFYRPLSLERTFLDGGSRPPGFEKGLCAATEVCSWRDRLIQGEVHDENAFALGGCSGHAGLFSDAGGVFTLLNLLRDHYLGGRDDCFRPETVRAFFTKQNRVDGCTWALGWDTPSEEGSSSGKYLSPHSVGHLGFTGTSIWMDLDKDITVVFLTNRVHPTRDNVRIRGFRPRLHDLIMEEMSLVR